MVIRTERSTRVPGTTTSLHCCRIMARATFISLMARACPTQKRGPAPKRQVFVRAGVDLGPAIRAEPFRIGEEVRHVMGDVGAAGDPIARTQREPPEESVARLATRTVNGTGVRMRNDSLITASSSGRRSNLSDVGTMPSNSSESSIATAGCCADEEEGPGERAWRRSRNWR